MSRVSLGSVTPWADTWQRVNQCALLKEVRGVLEIRQEVGHSVPRRTLETERLDVSCELSSLSAIVAD